jgi:HD-GYP domain-containing protein (c-di-GMP phosphodiesterase class II)
MPILLPVQELKPGMCVAKHIEYNCRYLLPSGHYLRREDIQNLQNKIPGRMIYIFDPLLDEVVDFHNDSIDEVLCYQVRGNMNKVLQKVDGMIRAKISLSADNIAGMEDTIREIIYYLVESPATLAIIKQSKSWDNYLQEHSAGVFYLSMLIGNTLQNYLRTNHDSAAKEMSLTPLATASILHDLGMISIDELYKKNGPLTDEEKQIIREHPENGASMLPGSINPAIKQIIRQHHENQDGTGYPEGLKGKEMNFFARIIRVADAFCAATANKRYQRAKSPIKVLHEMVFGSYHRFYDPIILKIFASFLQPFPIGAKLKLSNEQQAIVTKHNSKNPFAPEVIIAFDKQGFPLGKESLETPFYLNSRKDIHVLSFGEEDLSYINHLPDQEKLSLDEEKESKQYITEMFDLVYP